MFKRLQNSSLLLLVIIFAFLAALAALAYVGTFTRYMADDYCLSTNVRRMGFAQSQTHLYMTWTGRYSYNFLMSVAELIGPATVPMGPLVVLTCWLAVAAWSIYQIATIVQWPRALLTSWLVAELILFAMLSGADNIVQSLYWQGGLVNYVVPLILLTAYTGIVCFAARKQSQNPGWLLLASSAVITFFAGGLTEAYGVLQTGTLALAVIAAYKFASKSLRRAVLPLLVVGLIASSIALLVVTGAPGNVFRQSQFPPPPNLFRLTTLALYYSAGFIVYQIIRSPLTVIVLILALVGLGYFTCQSEGGNLPKPNNSALKRLVLCIPLIGFFLIFLCFLTGVYATSGALPERARFIPQFVFVVTTVCCAYFAGGLFWKMTTRHMLKPKLAWLRAIIFAAAAVLILLTPLLSVRRTLKLVPGASAGAAVLDQMDRDVRAARAQGLMDVTVPAMDDLETRLGARRTELQLERDPNHWKNKCAARYYGVNSITAR